ncbi:MAG: T9SS type A sorting domain-containing protein [Rhodothermales bacterium]
MTFEDIFSADTEVLVQVDARPAFYHLADSSGMPADVQTGDPVTSFDGLFANGPFASPNGWEDWGANLAAIASLQLVDDGTNGDAVAGDTVFTMTLMKTAGQAKRGVDLKFGVNGFDNESTFAGNHVMNVDEANPVVNLTFGAMLKADGTYEDSLYDPYIFVDNLSTPPSAVAVRRGGENDMIATNTEESTLPETVVLSQNYPNPFNPVTTIEYELANSGRVTLQVFDLLGRNVATLVDGVVPASRHSVQFDARNLASGTYIYRLVANDKVVTKTMVLLK